MIRRKVYIVASDTHVVKLNGVYKEVIKHNDELQFKISVHNKPRTAKALLTKILKDSTNGWYIDKNTTIEDIRNLKVKEVWEEYK